MHGFGNHRGIDQYREADAPPNIHEASPHELVQLMLDGAVTRVGQAIGALTAGETPLKCELIGKAVGLVEGLRISLDMERGGELAENLNTLYRYMARRLLEANLHSDQTILTEVGSLLRELQAGWREMGELVSRASEVPGDVRSAGAAAI